MIAFHRLKNSFCFQHNSSIIQLNRYPYFIFWNCLYFLFSQKVTPPLCENQQQRWCSSRLEFNFLWKLLISCFSRLLHSVWCVFVSLRLLLSKRTANTIFSHLTSVIRNVGNFPIWPENTVLAVFLFFFSSFEHKNREYFFSNDFWMLFLLYQFASEMHAASRASHVQHLKCEFRNQEAQTGERERTKCNLLKRWMNFILKITYLFLASCCQCIHTREKSSKLLLKQWP